MKYVILAVATAAKPEPTLHTIVFAEALSHREVYLGARAGLWRDNDSSCEVTPHSAGFARFRLGASHVTGCAVVSGRSETLNVGPHADGRDAERIDAALRGTTVDD